MHAKLTRPKIRPSNAFPLPLVYTRAEAHASRTCVGRPRCTPGTAYLAARYAMRATVMATETLRVTRWGYRIGSARPGRAAMIGAKEAESPTVCSD